MKKIKKLLALTSSLLICSSVLTAFNANANDFQFSRNSEEYKNFFKEYYETDDYGVFKLWSSSKPYKFHALNTVTSKGGFIVECIYTNNFTFTLSDSFDRFNDDNLLNDIIYANDSSYRVNYDVDNDSNYVYTITDKKLNPDTPRNARIMCDELKKQGIITSFIYRGNVSGEIKILNTEYLTGYYSDNLDELEEILSNYIVEKNLDCHIVSKSKGNYDSIEINSDLNAVCVVPNKELTLDEHLKLAAQIKNDLGYLPYTISPSIAYVYSFSDDIDLYNATYGDLNDDSKLTPVDASLLLSYYSESQIGTETEDITYELLGDVNNDGKITPVDASLVLKQYAENQTK